MPRPFSSALIHPSAWNRNSPKFAQPRSYAERYSYVQSRGASWFVVHKKLIIPHGSSTLPGLPGPIGLGLCVFPNFAISGVLGRLQHQATPSNSKDSSFRGCNHPYEPLRCPSTRKGVENVLVCLPGLRCAFRCAFSGSFSRTQPWTQRLVCGGAISGARGAG
jgi:hypothetical protein